MLSPKKSEAPKTPTAATSPNGQAHKLETSSTPGMQATPKDTTGATDFSG